MNFTKERYWVDFGNFGPLFDLRTHTGPDDPEKRNFEFAAQNTVQSAQNQPHSFFLKNQIISSFLTP